MRSYQLQERKRRNKQILVYVGDTLKISCTDGVIQTRWRENLSDFSAMPCKWLVHFVFERACGERLSSPRYLTRGAQKTRNNRHCKAETLYLYAAEALGRNAPVKKGVFGADMKIEQVNDGPFTLVMEKRREE